MSGFSGVRGSCPLPLPLKRAHCPSVRVPQPYSPLELDPGGVVIGWPSKSHYNKVPMYGSINYQEPLLDKPCIKIAEQVRDKGLPPLPPRWRS